MTPPPQIYALIVAAGSGSRAGDGLPKQYRSIGGKAVVRYACEALVNHPSIAGVGVVIHPDHRAMYDKAVAGLVPPPSGGRLGGGLGGTAVAHQPPPQPSPSGGGSKLLPPTIGGAERSDSVRAGLAALAPLKPDYVLVHDAARPFLSVAVLDRIIEKLTPDHAVLPALPVVDTVRRQVGDAWVELPRDGLLRMQTPQAFPFAALCAAYEFSSPNRGEAGRGAGHGELVAPTAPIPLRPVASGDAALTLPLQGRGLWTDEAALWLAASGKLTYVAGEEDLRKVTTAADMNWAQTHASTRRVAVGMGFDVHALMPAGDRQVIRLGGIDIASVHKLHGHSDADVVLHAITDALLGTVAQADIGEHFSPKDERWAGADSTIFLAEAARMVAAQGGAIQHLDVTVIGEHPKIAPHRDAMRAAIAGILNMPISRVSVKATTTEKLGFTGREEGIAAQAVATVSLPWGMCE